MSSRSIIFKDVSISFLTSHSPISVVKDVELDLREGRVTGLIGESGSGKTILGMSILQLLPKNAVTTGRIYYRENDILTFQEEMLQHLRHKEIALIPQNPGTSLDPVMTVGRQIGEALFPTKADEKRFVTGKIGSILEKINRSHTRIHPSHYPFELSGGMKQRVLTAMGICRNPKWLIADEPTKGLDACLRKEIGKVFCDLHDSTGCGIVMITHDLLLAESLCDHMVAMYCGEVIETAPVKDYFSNPAHPYSKALLNALPRGGFIPIPGESPSVTAPPEGCRFHPRCPVKTPCCPSTPPMLHQIEGDRTVRCHHYA